MKRYVLAVLLLLAAFDAAPASAELVVVVSARSSVASLTASHVAKIFLAKSSAYPDGSLAVPVDQAEGAGIRNEFYLKVTGKSPSQLRAYWARIIFAGDGQPPRALPGDEEIKQALARDPAAIGYIDRAAVDGRVRVVLEP